VAPVPSAPAPAGHPAPAAPATAKRDHKAAEAANARGMRLLASKKYKDAMAEFQKAIAAEPDHVLAHYNLACAASRAQVLDVANYQLAWIASAALWDATAAKAAKKEASDPDLKWYFDQGPGAMVADPASHVDLVDEANDEAPAVPAEVAKLLASAPGKHDDQCDTSGEQAHVRGIHDDKRWFVASLRDGVALVDGSKLLSRTDPLGCTEPGASQDRLSEIGRVSAGDLAPEGIRNQDLIVVSYGAGGRRSWTNNVAIFAVKNGTQLQRIFDATLQSSDDDSAGTLALTTIGDLVLGQPGAKQKRVFHWDPAAFRFVEAPR
jgi:hypothetical protein